MKTSPSEEEGLRRILDIDNCFSKEQPDDNSNMRLDSDAPKAARQARVNIGNQ
jgi:hypothetical protein